MKTSILRWGSLAATSLALVLAFACSPANPTPEVAKPVVGVVPDAATVSGPGFMTPAKWALGAPSSRWRPVVTLDVDASTKLHAGEGGERWLELATGNEGASSLAPEAIAGIQKADGGYRFVGASGSVYFAHEALGPLSRAGTPVPGARQVAVGKAAILVVDGKGDLQRSTDGGRSWRKAELPDKEGVVVDVAMLAENGILVMAPQRFYGTKDDGVTWTPVKSPGVGVTAVVARDGALWLDGVEDSMRFDPAWGTFSAAPGGGKTTRNPFGVKSSRFVPIVSRRIDGRRAVEVIGTPNDRQWSVAAGDVGALGKPKHMEELDGCETVSAALRGDRILLACDARGTVSGGIDKDAGGPVLRTNYGRHNAGAPDGGTLGWITRILRSDDSGRTFHEETTIEGGMPQRFDEAIAAGPEDFVYVGRRCGAGYGAPCLPARVRATKGGGFVDVPGDEDDSGQMRFASSSALSTAYSIGHHDGEIFLFRWKISSATPEPIGRVAENADGAGATLTLDDDGTVRGFVRESGKPVAFTYREGGSIATSKLAIPATHAAFAGVHGLAVGSDQKGYESVDGGKTWGVVAMPAFVQAIDACSSFGCVTDRGLRWGWDAPPAAPAADVATASKPQYQRPLRCSAKDKWTDVGGGNLPTIASVDHGSVRWMLPTRGKDGKIAVVLSKRGDPVTKTSSVALMGVPPGPPTYGSGTTMHVQPDGVVALRYSYLRARKGLGRYNPVDAQVAWYRDGTGKVFHATVNKNPPFRVNKDPQAGYERETTSLKELPELVALGPRGVYFHLPTYEDYDDSGNEPKRLPIMLLRDDGKVDKINMPEGLDGGGAGTVAQLEGTATLLAQNPDNWLGATLNDGHKLYWSVLGGEGEQDGVVDLINLGGKPGFAATLRDPARAWAIALKPESELGAASSIPTQRSLGDVPKPCDGPPSTDPTAYRVDAPYVVGSRRPVIVDVDGAAKVLATDRAEIRGTLGKPDACVAAFDAMIPSQDDDHDYGALIFTDDLAHALLFRADTSGWPATIAIRPMECQYQAGPLPQELEQEEGFVPDTRHAAVVHKRY